MIPNIPGAVERIEFIQYPSFTYKISNWTEEDPRILPDSRLRIWDDIKNKTWDEIKDLTWQQLKYHRWTDVGFVISGDIDGIEALKQAVFHRVLTERYAYAIYDDNYGTELEQYIGKGFEFLEATIQNTLSDSLLQDDRIVNVQVTNIQKVDFASALVEFDVYSNMGLLSGLQLPMLYGGGGVA